MICRLADPRHFPRRNFTAEVRAVAHSRLTFLEVSRLGTGLAYVFTLSFPRLAGTLALIS